MERFQVRILAGALDEGEVMGEHCWIFTMILLLIAIGFGITREKK